MRGRARIDLRVPRPWLPWSAGQCAAWRPAMQAEAGPLRRVRTKLARLGDRLRREDDADSDDGGDADAESVVLSAGEASDDQPPSAPQGSLDDGTEASGLLEKIGQRLKERSDRVHRVCYNHVSFVIFLFQRVRIKRHGFTFEDEVIFLSEIKIQSI